LINVQLIDARSDNHIWAQSYQRTLDNIFGVEGEVAEKVADALKAKLTSAETGRLASLPTQNQAAMDLYLRGEFESNRAALNHDTAAAKRALSLYRLAVDRDPGFALAWARASIVESNVAWYGGGGQEVKLLQRQARADADKALQLAPTLAEAHLALGYCDYYGRADYVAALKAFGEALALKPNDAEAFAARGFVERSQLRFDDAIASLREAFALDPRRPGLAYRLGTTNMMLGRYPEARDWLRRALAINPDNSAAKASNALTVLFTTGDLPRALEAAQGDVPILKLQRVTLLGYQRRYREALALLDSIPDTPDNFFVASRPLLRARLHGWLGQTDKLQPLYEQALTTATGAIDQLRGLGIAEGWRQVGEADLGLGRQGKALDAIAKSLAAIEQSPDRLTRPIMLESDAAAYAAARRADLAVPLLAKALAAPGIGADYAPVLLWLDPAWDPIRHDPRFQALEKQYAQYKPSVIPAIPSPAATTGGAAHD
jgi:tetratricopeptide (TPR) repeat protein